MCSVLPADWGWSGLSVERCTHAATQLEVKEGVRKINSKKNQTENELTFSFLAQIPRKECAEHSATSPCWAWCWPPWTTAATCWAGRDPSGGADLSATFKLNCADPSQQWEFAVPFFLVPVITIISLSVTLNVASWCAESLKPGRWPSLAVWRVCREGRGSVCLRLAPSTLDEDFILPLRPLVEIVTLLAAWLFVTSRVFRTFQWRGSEPSTVCLHLFTSSSTFIPHTALIFLKNVLSTNKNIEHLLKTM